MYVQTNVLRILFCALCSFSINLPLVPPYITSPYSIIGRTYQHIVGEPKPKFGKLQGRGATEGLKADSYVKQPAGSEYGLRL